MTIKTTTNQVIALAGLAQACSLVQQLATKGQAEDSVVESSISSIFKIDAASPADVFGGLNGIAYGLEQMQNQLTGRTIANPEQGRYAASLVYLERQLENRQPMMENIYTSIERIRHQSEHFGVMHENVLTNLSELYQDTISQIHPRVMVNGDPGYLSSPEIVNKIRSLLLAGIRSAMLWRQCGGARWKFLLYRRKLQEEVKFLRTQL